MTPPRRLPIGSLLASALLSLTSCGAPASASLPQLEAWPEGFATEYGLVFDMPFKTEPYPEAGLEGAVMVFERVTFVAPDGTSSGTAEFSALEYRGPDVAVTCDGERWEGRYGYDRQDPPGELNGEFDGGITIRLVPDRQVVVYEDTGQTGGYPECWEQTGTYTVTFPPGGTPGVKSGTYRWIQGSLELD